MLARHDGERRLGFNTRMDPYAVLGLEAGASPEDAARAYRQLAKQWHPDRAGDTGAARMIQLNVAYELVRAQHRPGAEAGAGSAVAPAGARGQDGGRRRGA
ncbi:MAG: J domain-containing protein, partial [Solirubrobacteraceae bacterium]|nr:J domain-containing protein [Solirubrobacteraceae bacterium]